MEISQDDSTLNLGKARLSHAELLGHTPSVTQAPLQSLGAAVHISNGPQGGQPRRCEKWFSFWACNQLSPLGSVNRQLNYSGSLKRSVLAWLKPMVSGGGTATLEIAILEHLVWSPQ